MTRTAKIVGTITIYPTSPYASRGSIVGSSGAATLKLAVLQCSSAVTPTSGTLRGPTSPEVWHSCGFWAPTCSPDIPVCNLQLISLVSIYLCLKRNSTLQRVAGCAGKTIATGVRLPKSTEIKSVYVAFQLMVRFQCPTPTRFHSTTQLSQRATVPGFGDFLCTGETACSPFTPGSSRQHVLRPQKSG